MTRGPAPAPLDDRVVEALLAGRPVPGHDDLHDVLALLRATVVDAAPAPSPALAAALEHGIAAFPARDVAPRGRRWAVRAAVAATVTAAMGLTAASASALPAPVQSAVADVVGALTPFELPRPAPRPPAGSDPATSDVVPRNVGALPHADVPRSTGGERPNRVVVDDPARVSGDGDDRSAPPHDDRDVLLPVAPDGDRGDRRGDADDGKPAADEDTSPEDAPEPQQSAPADEPDEPDEPREADEPLDAPSPVAPDDDEADDREGDDAASDDSPADDERDDDLGDDELGDDELGDDPLESDEVDDAESADQSASVASVKPRA
jgi:hypothetical protein